VSSYMWGHVCSLLPLLSGCLCQQSTAVVTLRLVLLLQRV
jgi:hypothetical protein